MTVIPDRVFARQKRYPRYAQSESKWLLEYPEHWTLQKLKHVSSVRFSNVDKHTKEGEQPAHLCNYVDVYYNQHISSDIEFMKASATVDEISRFSLRRGDVIVTKDSESWDDIAVPAYVSETLPGVLCGYHLALIRPNREMIDGKFLFQAFNAEGIKQQFQVAATGITRYGLGKHWLENSVFPVPPMPEQRAIASFLDHKTAQIDALIAEKRKLVELLQEKRNALISQAVTKGLNPDAPMKDSGVEWIGEIPAHWEVMPLGYVLDYISYGFTNPMPTTDEGPFMLTANDIGDGAIRFDTARRTSIKAFQTLLTDKSRPRNGDILLTKDGTLGRVAVCGEETICINQSVAVLRAKRERVLIEFLQNLLRSIPYQEAMKLDAGGTTIKHIYVTRLAKMVISLPPIEEQPELVTKMQSHRHELDMLVSEIENGVERLIEYRTALISAAVTGRIDVREWQEAGIDDVDELNRLEQEVVQDYSS